MLNFSPVLNFENKLDVLSMYVCSSPDHDEVTQLEKLVLLLQFHIFKILLVHACGTPDGKN